MFQRIKQSFSKSISMILVFSILMSLLVGMIPTAVAASSEAAAEPTPVPNSSNGYVSNISFTMDDLISFGPDDFNPATTSYDIAATDWIFFAFNVELTENAAELFQSKDLFYRVYFNGVPVDPTEHTDVLQTTNTITFGPDRALKEISAGQSGTFLLVIGQKGDTNGDGEVTRDRDDWFVNYDAYEFTVTTKPQLLYLKAYGSEDTLDIWSQGIPLNPTPTEWMEYQTLAMTDTYSVVVPGDDIWVFAQPTASWVNDNVKVYIGNSTTPVTDYYSNDGAVKLSLADYGMTDGVEVATIPIYLKAFDGDTVTGESSYTLYATNKDYRPVITEQPQNMELDKNEHKALSVKIEEVEGQTYSYQWMKYTQTIPGANEATYYPSTDRAGENEYSCVVSTIVDGIPFSTTSETVKVTVNLSEVSEPRILEELGTHYKSGDKYRTLYTAGEKLATLFIQMEAPEVGTEYSVDLYYSTTANTTNGKKLETQSHANEGGGRLLQSKEYVVFENYRIRIQESLPAGEYYVYCVVTATATDGSGKSNSVTSNMIHVTFETPNLDFTGEGSTEKPYLIETFADMEKLRLLVDAGDRLSGIVFKMTDDIELPENWIPIGYVADSDSTAVPFGGTLDGGGHKVTVYKGGLPLFARVSDARIQNLDIYGEEINGNGLINERIKDYGPDGNYWTGVPESVRINNVRLLSGSSTLGSGFMTGSGSGANTITITNCTVEDNVTIGYTKDQQMIGSFVGGSFNGEIRNCVSYADVYGTSFVGGLAGSKGQSMGLCGIYDSAFLGTITATGVYVGGLIGQGYVSESAPNTMVISFDNCYVAADITASDFVGGLLGAESGIVDAWDDYKLSNSFFYGTITATRDNPTSVGGIIGYYNGFNKIGTKENNYFYESSGTATSAVGSYGSYVTTDKVPERGFASEEEFLAFYENIGHAKSAEEFKDGTVLTAMVAGGAKQSLWQQGELYPVFTATATVSSLSLSGEYKTVYQVGDELDLTGLVAKATWSDGTETDVALSDLTITGFDSSKAAKLTLNVAYEGASAKIVIRVEEDFEPADTSVQVKFSVSHDDSFAAGEGSGEVAALYELDVPYFDLGLYGLEDYYYGGTATSANGNVTMLHLFLYATEVIECGYEESEAGQGLLYEEGLLGTTNGKLTLTGGSGAMYMTNFWGYDENLTYYLNYEYPLRDEAIGETADQIVLNDGDVVTLGHFSNWYFYTDDASGYNYIKTNAEQDTVKQGQSVELSVYRTKLQNYQTTQIPVEAVLDVYYTRTDNVSEDFASWEKLTTDASGKLTVDTSELEVGEYIFAVAGQMGSTVNAICSAPGGVILTVEKNEEDTKPTDPVTPVDPVIPSKPTTPTEPTEPETPVVGMNFSDVSTGDWFYEDVAYVYAAGLMNGMGNGKFAPDVTTTRGMIVTILYRLEGEPSVSGSCPFGDVNSGSYYEKAIAWAAANDIVNGYGNSRFGPNDPITREQMAVILCRYAQYKKLDVSVGEDTNILSFHDVSDISEYAFSAMQWACGDGIMQGDNGNLMPRGNATRAQIAALLHRFCEEILK